VNPNMVRVQCLEKNGGCGHSWNFVPRVLSWLLKRSYTVKCPECGENVFIRLKRHLVEPKEVVA